MIARCLVLIIGFLFALLSQVGVAWAGDGALYLSFEERLAASYALESYQKTPEEQRALIERASHYFKAWAAQEIQTKKVRNFDEFLKAFRGEWPSTHSLDLDLRVIEKAPLRGRYVYQAPSARIQKQIDQFVKSHNQSLLSIVVQEVKVAGTPNYASELMGLTWLLSQGHMDVLAEEALKRAGEIIGEQMKQIDSVGEFIADSKLGQGQDPQMRILLKTLFGEYFSRLNLDSKKLMAATYLGGDLRMSDLQKFEIMIQNSGPQLQKLLQVVARQNGIPAELLEVFRALESAVRPVPWVQVDKILAAENKNYDFTFFERKPLGVGTMAQVHRAKLKKDGVEHDVVVRFIKPHIAERVNEDHRILKDIAQILDANPEFRKSGAPKISPLVEDITETVRAELSQEDTIKRQLLAKGRYEKTVLVETDRYKNYVEFHVPEIYWKQNSQFMVQEMIFGKKLDKEIQIYKETLPGLKRVIVEEMALVWAREVLFGGGFFHSDLHQGNFMVEFRDPAIRVNILDYGMGGVITRSVQNNLLVLGAGLELMDAKLISEAFLNISEKSQNTVTDTQIKTLIEERVKKLLRSKEKPTVDQWTAWALDQGLRMPYEFINLNRGLVIVNKLLQDSGSALNVTSILRRLAMQNPLGIYNRLIVEAKFSRKDFLRLGWVEASKILNLTPENRISAPLCSQVFN